MEILIPDNTGEAWLAISACTTVAAVIVALLTPFLMSAYNEQRKIQMLARALVDQKEIIKNVAKAQENNTLPAGVDGNISIPRDQIIAALSKRLDTTLWSRFKFEIGPEPYSCFRPFFEAIEDIIRFEKDRTPSWDQFCIISSTEFQKEYEKTSVRCKYLRAY